MCRGGRSTKRKQVGGRQRPGAKGEGSKGSKRKTKLITREPPIRLTDDFSAEALQARKEWQDTFKVLKGKNLQPRILYPARLSFRI